MEKMNKSNIIIETDSKFAIYRIMVMTSLIIFPILQIYSLFGINLSSFVVGSLAIYGLFFKKIRFTKKAIPHYLWIYFVYFIIVTFFSGVYNVSEMPNRVAGVLFLLLQFVVFFSCSDRDTFYKLYRIVAIGTIVFFYIQEAGYNAVGLRIPGVIPFLPLDPTYAAMDAFGSFADYLAIVNRSSSFFSEPAHFAQFLLPFLTMTLYWEKGVVKWFLAGTTIVTLIMLESGNGIIGLCCVLIAYLFYLSSSSSVLTKISLLLLLPLIMALGIMTIGGSNYDRYYSERSSEITMSSSNGEVSSGFYRIYRGYYVYAEYNPIEKLFGVNNFYQIEYRIRQSSVSALFSKGDMYFNVIQAFLIKTGLVGLFLFILMINELWKGCNSCGKTMLLTFVVLSFIAALHMSSIMMVYFLIPYLEIRSKRKNISKI